LGCAGRWGCCASGAGSRWLGGVRSIGGGCRGASCEEERVAEGVVHRPAPGISQDAISFADALHGLGRMRVRCDVEMVLLGQAANEGQRVSCVAVGWTPRIS
jgi:hypothetical protein